MGGCCAGFALVVFAAAMSDADPGFWPFLFGFLFGAIGAAVGRARGFDLRLQAQLALCQLQIEVNTRPTVA